MSAEAVQPLGGVAAPLRKRREIPPWVVIGVIAVVGSLLGGAAASRDGMLPFLLVATLALLIGALVFQEVIFGVLVGWAALEGLAFPFLRFPLNRDLATFDRYIVLALGAAVLLRSWPRMATASRRVAMAFGLFALIYGLRSVLTDPLPLAPGQLPSSSIQPQVDFLQNVGLPFVVFLVAARTVTPQTWPVLAKALVILGVTCAAVAIAEWVFGFELATISGYTPFEDVSAGVIRAGGPYPTPSAFGAVMVVCLCATVYWMQAERAWLLGAAVLTVELVGLAPSFTKTVWGACFVAVILALGLRKRISSRMALVLFWAAILGGAVYTLVQKSPVVEERVTSANASDNLVGRFATWHQGISIFAHWPAFGAGIDQFVAAQQFVPPVYVDGVPAVPSPHNTFVSVLGETGIVGIAALLLLTVAIVGMIVAYRRRAETDEEVLFGAALVGAVVGYFLLSQTFTEIYDPPSTLLFALMLGAGAGRLNAIAGRRRSSAAPARSPAVRRRPRR